MHVRVDLDAMAKQTPQVALEDGEIIKCFTVPLSELQSELMALEDQGYGIHGIVGIFAQGIETARSWVL